MSEHRTLLDSILEKDERIALLSPAGLGISYASLLRQVENLAEYLQRIGIRRGDRISLVLPNGIEAVVSFLAAATAATAAPLNPAYRLEEFQFYIRDTGARALVVPEGGAEAARQAVGAETILIEVRLDKNGIVQFSSDSALARARALDPAQEGDVALVLHTSGTTSRPKRVPLRHSNLATSAANIARAYALSPDDVSLCVMPLFHVHGLVGLTLATLVSGGTVVIPPGFNALSFWATADSCRATWYSAAPSIHQMLLARAREGVRPPGAGRLRFIRSCSSALPPATMAELERQFGAPVLEAYGMTEASHQIATNPLPPASRKPVSVGRGSNVEVAVMDKAGLLLQPGCSGEVVIRGANVITGYEDNSEANQSSFTNGWFRTGDEGVLDSDGYLVLTSRIKELIVRGGEKISPREVDEVLALHPSVAEVATFGIAHKVYGEEVVSAVALRAPATEAELIAFCRSRLVEFKCPKKLYIVDHIPRTDTGKIQRRIVREKLTGQA
jgi:oxalate---CoA ligase